MTKTGLLASTILPFLLLIGSGAHTAPLGDAELRSSNQDAGKDLFPAHEEIRARVDAMARFYGMLGGVTHAEPFLQKEVGLVDDLLASPVKSI